MHLFFAFIYACCKGCVGGLLGGYIGFLAADLFLSLVSNLRDGKTWPWHTNTLIFIGFIALGVLIGCLLRDWIILSATATAGGWAFVCGIGMLTGHFPYNYSSNQSNWIWWVYLISAICLMIFGWFFQCAQKKKYGSKDNSAVTH